MEKEEIVKMFLGRGKLLTPKAVGLLEAAGPGILEDVAKQEGLVLDFSTREAAFGQESRNAAKQFRIIKTLAEKPKETTTEDFIKLYNSKYEKMKKVFQERLQLNFVSLNRVGNFRNEIHAFGIVKDIKQREKFIVELEDLTATMPVVFDEQENVELDDVIAIAAISAGTVLYGKKIIYPDVPLRPPATGAGKGCFVSDLHMKETPKQDIEKFFSWLEKEQVNYLFVAGDIEDPAAFDKYSAEYCYDKAIFVIPGHSDSDKEYPQLPERFMNKNVTSLSNPAMVEVGGLKVLMVHKFDTAMLKKRYLGKSKAALPEDYLVLEEVPDIVHTGHTHEPHIMNYKAITIVNSGSPLADFKPVVVDFATREAVHIILK